MASRGNGAAPKGGVPSHPLIERITVALVPKAGQDLQNLLDRTKLSKTDIVNRALTLYEFFDAQQRAGHDVQLRNRATGDIQTIMFF